MQGGRATRAQQARWEFGAFTSSVLVHVGLALVLGAFASRAEAGHARAAQVAQVDIEVAPPPPPPPEPEPTPEPPTAEPSAEPEPAPVRPVRAAAREPSAPPPAAAAPAAPPAPTAPPPLLVSEELSNEPGDSVPTGTNTSYRGGDMANNGIAGQGPVHGARPDGVPGGRVAPPALGGPVREEDLTERPTPRCDEEALRNFFPSEAQDQGITNLHVMLRITVDTDGRIIRAQALEDPGYGLARAAERALLNACHANAARDRRGQPVVATVRFRLRFELE